MTKSFFNRFTWMDILKGIVLSAALFCLIVSVLLIGNRIQSMRVDPVNTPALAALLEEVQDDPADTMVREQVRELNLLARKAYFTTAWQQRTGSILLLIGIAVLIASIKMLQNMRSGLQMPDGNSDREDDWIIRMMSRKWLLIGGMLLFALTLIVSLAPLPDLESEKMIASSDSVIVGEDVQESPEQDEIEPDQESDISAESDQSEPVNESVQTTPAETQESSVVESENQTASVEQEDQFENLKIESGATWPNFRGTGGNGVAHVKDAPIEWDAATGKGILWKTGIPLPGNSSPVVWGDNLFLTGGSAAELAVFCFDTHNGRMKWKQTVPAASGSVKNPHEDTGFAPNTVATDGVRVCAVFPTGALACFDFEGKLQWSQNLGVPDNHYGHASSLIIHKNILVVQWDQNKNSKLLGLNAATGKTVWETPRTVISWSSPICVNTGSRMELILTNSKSVTSFDPKTGRQLWNVDCMSGEMGPSAAYSNGFVYASNDYATTAAIRITDSGADLIWENDEELPDTASPLATKDYVFLSTSYAVIVCLDAGTGEMLWDVEYDDGFYASPILAGNRVYTLDMQGLMHIFEAGGVYKAVGESSVGEHCVATPAFADGRIYIRGNKHLFCIGMK